MKFPLTNFRDLNENTWPKVLKEIGGEIPDISTLQPKTLDTPVTIGGVDYTTVESALAAIAAALA